MQNRQRFCLIFFIVITVFDLSSDGKSSSSSRGSSSSSRGSSYSAPRTSYTSRSSSYHHTTYYGSSYGSYHHHSSGGSTLSTGAIIGIVCGIIGLVVLIAAIQYCCKHGGCCTEQHDWSHGDVKDYESNAPLYPVTNYPQYPSAGGQNWSSSSYPTAPYLPVGGQPIMTYPPPVTTGPSAPPIGFS